MSTRTGRLTKRTVDAAAPSLERYIVWDTELKGFGLRVEPSGTKSFLVRYRSNGRKRFLSVGRYGPLTPDVARGLARGLLASVDCGQDPAETRLKNRQAINVRDLAARFLEDHVDAKRKGSTASHYRSAIVLYLLPTLGARKAYDLTRTDLARLHLSMKHIPYRANHVLAVVASMYSFGAKHGIVPDGVSPALGIERYPEPRRERFLSSNELARLGEAFRHLEVEGRHGSGIAALRLLLFSGARLREILHLRWENVDLERGMLFLPDSKTGRKTIVLGAPAITILASLNREGTYVIPGKNFDQPRTDLKKPWAAAIKLADLPNLRIHDLRHSFASVGAGAGLGLPIVGKLLGHSQAATTERYAHLDAGPVRRAADMIGNTISAALEGIGSSHLKSR
ncbi:site-specific integrase [Methylocystis sp. Sn-Cys]|uniref:tyrosine-type recombinase/integrase n=1 Tax=Methylocystis sp. Sn-Cys TaxID=1701263 RepID=UPI0019217B2B|nr:site-specific integrase [Methylocystis sp. Sn-Cys]MBL1255965.1 site-specific integrase [Methylocystis sp. Sn-Cys]